MPASMVIDQVGLPAGVAGVSRTDGLRTGAKITLSSVGVGGSSHRFQFLWTPAGDTTAVGTLTQTADPRVWEATPTVNAPGTYRIELIVDEGLPSESRQIRLLRVRTALHGIIIPALNEVADPTASLINAGAAQVDASEDNATDYAAPLSGRRYAGWWRYLHQLAIAVDANSSTWAGLLDTPAHTANAMYATNAAGSALADTGIRHSSGVTTFPGNVAVKTSGSNPAYLTVDPGDLPGSGAFGGFEWKSAGVRRWLFAENGSRDLELIWYNSSAVQQGIPIKVLTASGAVEFSNLASAETFESRGPSSNYNFNDTNGGVDAKRAGWSYDSGLLRYRLYNDASGSPVELFTINRSAMSAGDANFYVPNLVLNQGAFRINRVGGGADALMVLDSDAGRNRRFYARSSGVDRWIWGADASAESGANAGSNADTRAYSDAGAYIGSPLRHIRATLLSLFGGDVDLDTHTLWMGGGAIDAELGLIRNVEKIHRLRNGVHSEQRAVSLATAGVAPASVVLVTSAQLDSWITPGSGQSVPFTIDGVIHGARDGMTSDPTGHEAAIHFMIIGRNDDFGGFVALEYGVLGTVGTSQGTVTGVSWSSGDAGGNLNMEITGASAVNRDWHVDFTISYGPLH